MTVLFVLAFLHSQIVAETLSPLSLDARVDLFVHLASTSQPPHGFAVELANVTKSPSNPLLQEGLSNWDMAWWNTYPTVIFNDDGGSAQRPYKLWYNGLQSCDGKVEKMCPAMDYPNRTSPGFRPASTDRRIKGTLYAESADGITWERPALHQVPWPNRTSSSNNNIAIDAGDADPNRGVMLDLTDANASRRYKAFGSFRGTFNGKPVGKSHLGIVSSADGIAWHSYVPVDSMDVNADTANNMLWDGDLGKYIAFTRKDVKTDEDKYGIRREFRSESTTFDGPWPLAVEVGRGEKGYELYSLLPWRHPSWAAGTYLGLGSFYADGESSQRVHCELMSSSDYGGNWTRLAPRQDFIPLGPTGNFDDHTCYAARPIIDPASKNESVTRLYYAGGNGPHSGARSDFIALAYAPTHAMVGLAAYSQNVVSMTTRPLSSSLVTSDCAHRRLFLTHRTQHGGSIIVEALSASDSILGQGWLQAEGDGSITREAVFLEGGNANDRGDLVLAGEAVRLRLRVKATTLYTAELACADDTIIV